MIKTETQSQGAVAEIRKIRRDFYDDYMRRHQKFDIHQFVDEFLGRKATRKAKDKE